jgi:1-acyl-sn-glycerol-3-phosphate acyltransferase
VRVEADGAGLEHPRFMAAVRTVGRRALLPGYLRLRVSGDENVPAEGGLLLAANHTSFLDGPVLFGVSPRPVTFLIKAEMFGGVFGWALRQLGQVPVRRGTADRTALLTALNALHSGQVVGIFPEGGRGRQGGGFAEFERGVAWLALRSGVPVVPVAIAGAEQAWPKDARLPKPRRQVTVYFGEPLQPVDAPAAATRKRVAEVSDAIRQALIEHLERAQEIQGQ